MATLCNEKGLISTHSLLILMFVSTDISSVLLNMKHYGAFLCSYLVKPRMHEFRCCFLCRSKSKAAQEEGKKYAKNLAVVSQMKDFLELLFL